MLRFKLLALFGALHVFLPTDSIKCHECILATTSSDGVVSSQPVIEEDCESVTCNNVTKCAYGYASISYNKTTNSGNQLIRTEVQYFKGCKDSQYDSCDAMKDAIIAASDNEASESEIKSSVIDNCMINECDSNNCNNLTPIKINPSGSFESIQCYSCEYTTFGGGVDGMDANHECNASNIVTCPLGVTKCIAGNSAAEIQNVAYVTHYRKGCDGTQFSDCDSVFKTLESMNAISVSCYTHECRGNKCNVQTSLQISEFTSSLAAPLLCQECRLTTTSTDGVVSPFPSVDSNCVTKTCDSGVTECAYGYASFVYNTSVESNGFETLGMSSLSGYQEIGTKVQYFKGCKNPEYESCNKMKDAMASDSGLSAGQIESCEIEECVINTCDTDTCNNIEPVKINPSGSFEPIQCYSCEKTTMSGIELDDSYQECNATNIVTCPVGVTVCTSGYLNSLMLNVPVITEYKKYCGGSISSSCISLSQSLTAMGAEVEKCAVVTCQGNLCNNHTTEEIAFFEDSLAAGHKSRVDWVLLLVGILALVHWKLTKLFY